MLYHVTAVVLFIVLLPISTCRSVTAPPSGMNIIDGLCMNRRTDRLVYRHKNDTHVYIAFDVLKTGKVHVYTWGIIRADKGTFITPVKEETVLALDFRHHVNRNHILGATGRRHYHKFVNRLKRKMKHCKRLTKKKKHCKMSAIMSVLVRLKVRNVRYDLEGCSVV